MDGVSSSSNQTTERCETVLIIEDERYLVPLLKEILSRQHYKVLTALDGDEAVEVYYAHKKEIDVVLLDVGLPKISGVDVFLKIKRENPNVRVVVMTGYLDPKLKTKFSQIGVKRFLSKPCTFREIIEALQPA
jgi:two-component system, cell cycle sensor histidine kinase and response regulator CckA